MTPEGRLAARPRATTPHVQQQLAAIGSAEVIVVVRPRAGAAASASGLRALAGHFSRSERSQPEALRTALVQSFAAGAPGGRAARARARAAPKPVRTYPNLGVMLGTVDRAGLAALEAHPDVDAVCGAPPFGLIAPKVVGAARLTKDVTWGIEALGVGELWRQGLSGAGVRVAHLDTGVDAAHPALRGALDAYAEFDELGELEPAARPNDSGEHGTHTAATIAGRAVAGRSVGVAPGAKLASAQVIEGGNVVARVLGGLDWAVGRGVRVLSMSLGFPGWWEDFLPIVQILRARGVLPVIASGNEGPGTSRSPGNYAEALSVGACDQAGRVASFSSSQSFARPRDPIVPDLVGPGVNVISAKPGGGYQALSGTSMATPHVAGVAALLFEAKTGASVDEVERVLLQSCRLPAGQVPDRAGHGLLDARDAFSALTGIPLSRGTARAGAKGSKGAPRPKKKRAARPPPRRG
jgi:subtilisin